MFRVAILALALCSAAATLFSNRTGHMEFAFDEFKHTHNKVYTSAAEEAKRFAIFVENLRIADARNVAERVVGGTAVHGVTRFSDLSRDEFKARYLTAVEPARGAARHNLVDLKDKPASTSGVDVSWIGTYTTPVKDQGYCGSCWAFSATEQIESDSMRTLGDDYILSPQQITSCDTTSDGCDGGWTWAAYRYVENAGGIETNAEYPYSTASSEFGITGSCTSDSSDFKVTVDDYYTLSSESAMASYMESTGPISVCLDAESWNSYSGGVMSVCGDSVDHCVQAVGLNTVASTPYWVVRNSWGTSWGEDGYIYLKYGQNTCDITNDPTYTSVSNV